MKESFITKYVRNAASHTEERMAELQAFMESGYETAELLTFCKTLTGDYNAYNVTAYRMGLRTGVKSKDTIHIFTRNGRVYATRMHR